MGWSGRQWLDALDGGPCLGWSGPKAGGLVVIGGLVFWLVAASA